MMSKIIFVILMSFCMIANAGQPRLIATIDGCKIYKLYDQGKVLYFSKCNCNKTTISDKWPNITNGRKTLKREVSK